MLVQPLLEIVLGVHTTEVFERDVDREASNLILELDDWNLGEGDDDQLSGNSFLLELVTNFPELVLRGTEGGVSAIAILIRRVHQVHVG